MPRSLLLLLLLAACAPPAADDPFNRGSDDDDAVGDDDDAVGDDDDAAADDDDGTQDLDPNCDLTVDGQLLSENPDGLNGLFFGAYRPDEVNDLGIPQTKGSIEVQEIEDPEFPLQYRICGVQAGTALVAFLYTLDEEVCTPGNLFGSLLIEETTAQGLLDQDLPIDHVLSEEDCEREGEPPPE